MKTTRLILALLLVFVGITLRSAAVTMRISVDNGTNWLVIEDNGPLDLNSQTGAVVYVGSIGDWTFGVWGGQSLPYIGSPAAPDLDLSIVNYSSQPANIIVQLSDTNLTTFPSQTFMDDVSVIPSGTVNYASFRDPGNVLFGTTNTYAGGASGASPSSTAAVIFVPGTVTSFTSLSNGVVVTNSGSAPFPPYSLTLELAVAHFSSGTSVGTQVDAHLYTLCTPPDPAPLTNQLVNIGSNVLFDSSAWGTTPLTYTWLKGTNLLTGETNGLLTLTNISPTDAGTYTVIVASDCGSVTNSATLTVNTQPVAEGLSVTLAEDTSTNLVLQATNSSGGTLTFAIVSPPAHGTLTAGLSSADYTYLPDTNYFGSDSFSFNANDGHTNSAPATVTLTITSQNDAPQLTVPGSQTIGDALPLVFNTNRLISVSDVDAATNALEVSLSVSNGAITLGSTNNLVFVSGANSSSNLVVQGNLTALNGALSNLTYVSTLHYAGSDNLALTVNDLSNSGAGGALTDAKGVAITVVLTNHAPVIVSTAVTNLLPIPLRSTQTFDSGLFDLSTWQVVNFGPFGAGAGEWLLSASNLVAEQIINGDPTILLSDISMFGDHIQGNFVKTDTTDDDFIGFVFGYQNSSNFYVFDWKQADQTIGTFAERGMSVKVITSDPAVVGTEPLWSTFSTNSANAHTLYHNTTIYETGTNYTFTLDYLPGDFTIRISNGTNVLANIHLNDTSYLLGKFGFYNFSQADVFYSGFSRQRLAAYHYTYQAVATDLDGDSLAYSLVSGPTNMTINATNGLVEWAPDPTFTGNVTVTIAVNDGHGGSTSQTFVIFVPLPIVNQPPFVSAGPNRAFSGITNVITLNGLVVDDGVPTNTPLAISWSKILGPGNVTFGNSNSAVSTAAFSAAGFYRLQLVGSDSLELSTNFADIRADMLCSMQAPTNIVAWLPGTFDAHDVITGTTGILQNVSFPLGEAGPAFSFNGTNSSVRLPAQSSYDVGTNSNGFTVEFWMNPSRFQVGSVLGWTHSVRIERFTTTSIGDSLHCYVTGTGAGQFVDASRLWNGSSWTWIHLAVVYDRPSGQASFYTNGVLFASVNVGTNVMSTAGDFYLGQVPGSANAYGGLLDEVSIYSRPLNPEEIFDIFAAGFAGKCPDDHNVAPMVYAGPDLFVRGVPGAATLAGEVSDDGLPVDSSLRSHWSQFSGPGTVSFADATSPTTTATFSTNGVYVLQLSVDDGEAQSSDLVEVRVEDFCSVENPQGLMAWWPANGIEKEAINGYDAILANGAGYAVGSVAAAFNFDGVNDYVKMPAHTNYDVGTSAAGFSMEFWMSAGGFQNGSVLGWANGVRVERINGGSLTGDSLRFYVGGTNSGQFITSQKLWNGFTIQLNQWVHIVLTYVHSTGVASIYVNGLLNATGNVGTNVLSTADDFYLQQVPGSSGLFKGQLDEVSLYARPLSVTEVLSLFSSGSVGKCLEDSDQPPLVTAGADFSIASTNVTATLSGVVVDDGMPSGSTVFSQWKALPNVGTVTFAHSNSPSTTATFSTNGVYTLQLIADDGEKQASDFIDVRVGMSCPVMDTAGQVAWWPANGTVIDKINGYSGVLVNGSGYTNGIVSEAFQFYGTNDFVLIPAQTNYDIGQSTNGFTVEFWVRGPFTGPQRGIVSWNNSESGGSANGVQIFQSSSGLFANIVETNGTGHSVSGVGNVFNGDWQHVALTYDRAAGVAKLYTNGVAGTTQSVGTFQPQTSYDLQLGRVFNVGSSFLGQVDELGLYTRPLAQSEIQAIFNAGAAGKCVTPSNTPPVVSAGPDQAISLPNSVTLHGIAVDDGLPSNTLAVAWTYIAGSSAVFFSATNTAVTTVSFTNAGIYTFQLSASDGQFATNDTVTVTVLPDLRARPTVTITNPANESAFAVPIAGTTNLTFTTAAADADGQVTNVSFFLNGSGIGSSTNAPYTATVTALGTGTYTITAIATDNDGLSTTSAPVTVVVFVDSGSPDVGIFKPADSTIVTAPTNLIGIVNSPILDSYIVRYRLAPPGETTSTPTDDAGWSTLATGSTTVISNTLALFDPTMLLNGIYEVQVVATDLEARTSYSEVTTLLVDRNLKIGNFTLSFSDLSVPVAGIPIEIVRTYDSRDQRTNDFGVGWSLDIRNVRLQKSRNLGPSWFEDSTGGTFPTYFIDPVQARDLTVTLANGREFKFTAKFSPESQLDVPIESGTVTYEPTSDTYATLESVRGDDVEVSGSIPGVVDLFDVETSGLFNPTLFKLTTEEGEVYIIDEVEGLKSLTDKNGNTLLVSTNGVVWTNIVTGGTSVGVTFVRDAEGRISQILDPQGNALNYTYGTNGSLATFTDRQTNTTSFAYTNAVFPHYLTGITDPRGVQAIRTEYDDTGRMIRQTDGSGNTVEFTHDLPANSEIIRDRLGHVTIHEYDEDGNIVRTTDTLGNVTASKYDAADNLLEQVDALGNTNSYTYDDKGNKLSETDPLGFTTHYTYGPLRTLTSMTTPRGFTTTNNYDPDTGALLQQTDPLGNVTSYSYDGNGNLLSRTDALGNVMSMAYDSLGHMTNTATIDALRGTLNSTAFTYDTNGNQLTKSITRTTPSGPQVLTTSYTYDKENRLIETVNPDGSTNATIYALGLNKPAVEIDPLGRQTLHLYDERGNLTNTVYADGTSESYGYDAENRKVAMADRAGRTMFYGYDALARMTNTVFADGAVSNVVYDAIGRIIATADSRGNATHYTYDPNCGCSGRQAFITNALGQVTHRSYDEDANESTMIDALGRTTTYVYDELDRQKSVIFQDGSFTLASYDAIGRRIAETDQSTNTTRFAYDALGRLAAVTNALGKITTYAYDEVGSLVSQTDANNHTTTYEYDSMGRRTKRTLPGSQVETYHYDLAGNLTNRVDFNGHSTGYGYDPLNRLLSKTPDAFFSAPTVALTYTPTGQRATMIDAAGTNIYQYNSRDWLTNKTWTPPGFSTSLALHYTYDSNGDLTTIQSSTPCGTAVTYEYDALNRLSGVNDAHVGCCTEYGYDAVGNLLSQAYPNGINNTYQYDLLNRLTNLTTLNGSSGLAAKYDYTVAPTGHRLTAAENVAVTNVVRTINRIYTYDATYRLINESLSATGPVSLPGSASVGYSLDDVGNRLSRTTSGFSSGTLDSASHTYDADDRLTSDTYDANGNTTAGHLLPGSSSVNDAYDFEDRLINRNSGQVVVAYDGDGNRIAKTIGGVTTLFLVDDRNPTEYAQVLEELITTNTQTPALVRAYTYGTDLLSQDQLLANGLGGFAWNVSFYGYDGHGNVRYLTDTNSAVTDTFDYDAFGTLIAHSGSTPNSYLYCGEQFDADLELYYNRARYLNVDSGRFWTMDLFEGDRTDPISIHKFFYAGSDPIAGIDPSGLLEEEPLEAQAVGAEVDGSVKNTSLKVGKRVAKKIACEIVPGQIVSGVYVLVISKIGGEGAYYYIGQSKDIATRLAKWSSELAKSGEIARLVKLIEVVGGNTAGAKKLVRELVETILMRETEKEGISLPRNANWPIDEKNIGKRLNDPEKQMENYLKKLFKKAFPNMCG